MTLFNFLFFALSTVVAFGFCREDDKPVVEIADKDIVKGVVEVCLRSHVIINEEALKTAGDAGDTR